MIEALFNQPNYLAAQRVLDLTTLRQEVIQGNMANLETPGYKRLDVGPAFESQLRQAVASGDAAQLAHLRPEAAVDSSAVSSRRDGNTVNLEDELLRQNHNALEHTLATQLVTGALLRMRLAITGRPQ
jgi:flagellar basal-body rod protein FlgB